jgi:spore maturation protein CgeB
LQKILFFQWHSFMNEGIERALNKLEYPYDTFFYQFTDWERDDRFCELFREKLKSQTYRCVLSVNYAPLISDICEELGVLYISWVYDSPVHIRNTESMTNSCNRIYFFDRGQAQIFEQQGICAKHLPLAVDTEVWKRAIGGHPLTQKADVSMVGQLYQTQYQYFTAPLDQYERGYLEGIINAQMKIYGGYLIPELVTDKLLSSMNGVYKRVASDGFQMQRRELEYLLAQEVTGRERYLALALLSKRFDVELYSLDRDERLKDVVFCGYADYSSKMPQVFAQTRINLNISLKTIRTGIPLRILDIMGCGGFVMSNYQEELSEYFTIGQECEIYENLEDLVVKTEFYLHNEDLRRQIAVAGFEKVKRDFSFEDRIKHMLG